MSFKIKITLLKPHRVLGSIKAKGAQCVIHKGVATDLINRGIVEITNDQKESEGRSKTDNKGGGGEEIQQNSQTD